MDCNIAEVLTYLCHPGFSLMLSAGVDQALCGGSSVVVVRSSVNSVSESACTVDPQFCVGADRNDDAVTQFLGGTQLSLMCIHLNTL